MILITKTSDQTRQRGCMYVWSSHMIKSNFVTFVVTYASTEEALEGQKAKYMTTLNCTVASVPTREYVFV